MVTAANLGAVAILALASPTIQAFFVWPTLVAILNVLVVRAAAWRVLRLLGRAPPHLGPSCVKRIWRFSAGIAVTAILGAIFL